MSLINTEIKPFQATAYQNGQFIDISDADLKGKWSVVFFYPADFTFVCPTELEDLADQYAEFQKLGVEIYSVSTDTHFTHKAWHDTSDAIGKIQYAMIGDPTWTISKNFEVLIEAEGLADRGTFVIDPEGKIQIVEINAGVLVVMLRNYYAKSKQPFMSIITRVKSALPSGKKVMQRLRHPLIWWVKSKPEPSHH